MYTENGFYTLKDAYLNANNKCDIVLKTSVLTLKLEVFNFFPKTTVDPNVNEL